MRKVGVVTVGRSDYGIYLPVLEAIQKSTALDLHLFVAGAHLCDQFGATVREIEERGFPIAGRIDMLLASDTPEAVGTSMGLGLLQFVQAYSQSRPDLLIVLGDRFEMHSATVAAVPLRLPVAHLHGGEVTEGAIDELLRHSITKLSHLHFVATTEYRRRVIQLGEEPWRVMVSGAPALDRVGSMKFLNRQQVEARFGICVQPRTVLATFHPVTQEPDETHRQMANLLQAVSQVDCHVVFTYPNADAGNGQIVEMLRAFEQKSERMQVVVALGPEGYFSLMNLATAMIGNSSSGLIEAASFGLPVVNVGNRQRGRLRPPNVRDVGEGVDEIADALRDALSPDTKARMRDMQNPYGDGNAAPRIVEVLERIPLDQRLLMKRFHDLPAETALDRHEDSFIGIGENQ